MEWIGNDQDVIVPQNGYVIIIGHRNSADIAILVVKKSASEVDVGLCVM